MLQIKIDQTTTTEWAKQNQLFAIFSSSLRLSYSHEYYYFLLCLRTFIVFRIYFN